MCGVDVLKAYVLVELSALALAVVTIWLHVRVNDAEVSVSVFLVSDCTRECGVIGGRVGMFVCSSFVMEGMVLQGH